MARRRGASTDADTVQGRSIAELTELEEHGNDAHEPDFAEDPHGNDAHDPNFAEEGVREDEELSFRAEVRSDDPEDPDDGQIWYRDDEHEYRGVEDGAVVIFDTSTPE